MWQDCEHEIDLDDSLPLAESCPFGTEHLAPRVPTRLVTCTDHQPRFANSLSERKTTFSTVMLNVCTTCRDKQHWTRRPQS